LGKVNLVAILKECAKLFLHRSIRREKMFKLDEADGIILGVITILMALVVVGVLFLAGSFISSLR
jgi:Fe2+ transport system protein B